MTDLRTHVCVHAHIRSNGQGADESLALLVVAGRAWIRWALNERSFDKYLQSVNNDPSFTRFVARSFACASFTLCPNHSALRTRELTCDGPTYAGRSTNRTRSCLMKTMCHGFLCWLWVRTYTATLLNCLQKQSTSPFLSTQLTSTRAKSYTGLRRTILLCQLAKKKASVFYILRRACRVIHRVPCLLPGLQLTVFAIEMDVAELNATKEYQPEQLPQPSFSQGVRCSTKSDCPVACFTTEEGGGGGFVCRLEKIIVLHGMHPVLLSPFSFFSQTGGGSSRSPETPAFDDTPTAAYVGFHEPMEQPKREGKRLLPTYWRY